MLQKIGSWWHKFDYHEHTYGAANHLTDFVWLCIVICFFAGIGLAGH